MAKQINVVAAVGIDEAKLLAGRREGGRLGEGFWELPGGKLNPGEDPRRALMRELKEELGVASYIGERVLPTVVHTYDWGEVHMQVFYAGLKGNALTAVAHDAFRWGTPQELADLNWLGAAKPVIAKLQGMDLTKVVFPAAGTVYTHTVQYYETDRMGITHHSNYVRWMEEARTHFLAAIGWDYAKIEAAGIISPVVSVSCRYKRSTTFSDHVVITTKIAALDRVRLTLSYRMECHDQLVCEGTSEHCFTNQDGKLLRLNRDLPDFYQALQEASQVK